MSSDSSLDQINKLIQGWELSGLSMSAFCREQQLSYHEFNYWHKRIGASVRSAATFVQVEEINTRLTITDRITVSSKSGMKVTFPMIIDSIP